MIKYNPTKEPVVSVVIPTYEKHHKYLQDAVDSIRFEEAEVIIVNDSSVPLEAEGINITVYNRPGEESLGTGWARNKGAMLANTELLIWLDSDDLFLPNGVNLLYNTYKQTIGPDSPSGSIVYGGLLRGFDNMFWPMKEQYCGADINKSGLITPAMPYCILIPKEMHNLIGGYDEAMITWEDVDYEKKITVNGLCTTWIPNSAVFWYRWESGERRALSDEPEIKKQVSAHMYKKYEKYHTGEEKLGNCNTCGGQPVSPYKTTNQHLTGSLPSPEKLASNEELYLEYIGTDAVHTEMAPVTENTYRWGRSSRLSHRRKKVVNKTANLADDEVSRLDADEFVQRRKNGKSYEWKYSVEIVIGKEPVPLRQREQAETTAPKPNLVGADKNPDVSFIFEQTETVLDFTISEMEEKVASGELLKGQLQTFLEQEQRQESPRKGMVTLLNDALKSI